MLYAVCRAAAVFGASSSKAQREAIKVLAGCIEQLQTEMAGAYKDEGPQVCVF